MLVVAGLSLKNLKPRVWDPASPYFLPRLEAVMVSYAEFHLQPARARAAANQGLHAYLGVPEGMRVYLDNGAFNFLKRNADGHHAAYAEFVANAKPDWWPIPQDFIPTPAMTDKEQLACLHRTMDVNRAYEFDGYVPVIHVGRLLAAYVAEVQTRERLLAKRAIALGGIVPNLLRARSAMPYGSILDALRQVRRTFAGKDLHLFGVGGTATLHLAALLGIDSADSSGWRNRAARGIVQLPGSGDRMVADLGSWRGRKPSPEEWERLTACPCPACRYAGVDGLKSSGVSGFSNRAAHNLWVLLEEAHAIETRLTDGSYADWYEQHLDNSIYLPLIRQTLRQRPSIVEARST